MEVVHARCAGLDVHKKVIVVCGLTPEVVDAATGPPAPQLERFGTMTEELVALAGWLVERGITTVAMESTGVYWQPVWNILEEAGGFALLLVNAQHVKAIPADYPHRQHGLSGRDGHGHRPGASAVRAHLHAG
jgi:hypothetical protein